MSAYWRYSSSITLIRAPMPQSRSANADHPPAAKGDVGFWQLFLGAPRARRGHMDALDGLRGLAVLIVIASHMAFLGLNFVPGMVLAGIGKSGVYLFFVLSSFLLTRILLRRDPPGFADSRLWADYALRRVLRIWPLYLVVLLLSWGLTVGGVSNWYYQLDTPALLRHLALREGQSVLWSIPVEFKFYLWLPLVALGLAWTRWRRWPLLAEVLVLAALLVTVSWIWPPAETANNDVRLGPYLALFVCGAFAARLDLRLGERGAGRVWAWGLTGLLALLAFVASLPEVWSALTGSDYDRRVSQNWFVFFGLLWSCLLLSVLHGPRWMRAPFAWAPLRLLGVVSFSAYLWHMPILRGLDALGARAWPLGTLLAVAVVTILSMASYLAFEYPWRGIRIRSSAADAGTWKSEPIWPAGTKAQVRSAKLRGHPDATGTPQNEQKKHR